MDQQLLNRVLESPRLPSLPTIALEIIDLVQQQDVDIKQIAKTIQHDPALSSKILKTVNSSFYGQAHTISTISKALVVLGLNSVKTLALGFTLVGNLRHAGDDLDHMAFWKRSLYTAVAARSLAKQTRPAQQEEAFLGGLLQDVGMLAMAETLGAKYTQIVSSVAGEHHKLREAEQDALGIDHAQIGGALAERWKLPPVLVAPLRYHEQPDEGPHQLQTLIRCVVLGNRVADVCMSDKPGPALEAYYGHAQDWFNLPQEQADALLKSIHADTVERRRLFDLPTGVLENPNQILARANEALLNLNMQQQRQHTALKQQNKQLIAAANTDALTGVANRRRFDQFITEQFKLAGERREPLSVLFSDADRFKKFNDTYGHQTGDRVLAEVANTLQRAVPEQALVARYGGEEFSVVLPETDRATAANVAENIRRQIELMTIESDEGQKLSVTLSIGVATYDGEFFADVEQLISAADQAVYAAKAAGRNRVRIFTPRPAPRQPNANVA